MIRNFNNLNNQSDELDESVGEKILNGNSEIKKISIKNELMDNLLEKYISRNSISLEQNNRFNNYPKSVTIKKKKYRDMKINLKKIVNTEKMKLEIPDLYIESENKNSSELSK